MGNKHSGSGRAINNPGPINTMLKEYGREGWSMNSCSNINNLFVNTKLNHGLHLVNSSCCWFIWIAKRRANLAWLAQTAATNWHGTGDAMSVLLCFLFFIWFKSAFSLTAHFRWLILSLFLSVLYYSDIIHICLLFTVSYFVIQFYNTFLTW